MDGKTCISLADYNDGKKRRKKFNVVMQSSWVCAQNCVCSKCTDKVGNYTKLDVSTRKLLKANRTVLVSYLVMSFYNHKIPGNKSEPVP